MYMKYLIVRLVLYDKAQNETHDIACNDYQKFIYIFQILKQFFSLEE